MPKKKSEDPKLQARLNAKVRPDEPVKDERIYINMPKKKAPAKKKTTELDAVVQKEIIEEATGDAPSIKKAGGGIARMLGE